MTAPVMNIRTIERDAFTGESFTRALNLRTPLLPGDTLPAGIVIDLINEDEARSGCAAYPLEYRTHRFLDDGTLIIECEFTIDEARPTACTVWTHLTAPALALRASEAR
jgi:hypothetical protein